MGVARSQAASVLPITLAATTTATAWAGVTWRKARTAVEECARVGASSVRASAATLPLSGYAGFGLNLRSFVLVALDRRAVEGHEQAAVRAFEAGVPLGASRHQLGRERLAAVGADDLV